LQCMLTLVRRVFIYLFICFIFPPEICFFFLLYVTITNTTSFIEHHCTL
jgi:hypothetical protein